jgi:hypothetical protein
VFHFTPRIFFSGSCSTRLVTMSTSGFVSCPSSDTTSGMLDARVTLNVFQVITNVNNRAIYSHNL